jgi:hypothetical protein
MFNSGSIIIAALLLKVLWRTFNIYAIHFLLKRIHQPEETQFRTAEKERMGEGESN